MFTIVLVLKVLEFMFTADAPTAFPSPLSWEHPVYENLHQVCLIFSWCSTSSSLTVDAAPLPSLFFCPPKELKTFTVDVLTHLRTFALKE